MRVQTANVLLKKKPVKRLRKAEVYFTEIPKKVPVTVITKLPKILINKRPISTAIKYFKLP